MENKMIIFIVLYVIIWAIFTAVNYNKLCDAYENGKFDQHRYSILEILSLKGRICMFVIASFIGGFLWPFEIFKEIFKDDENNDDTHITPNTPAY